MTHVASLRLVGSVVLVATIAMTGPVAYPHIPALISAADAIIVARIQRGTVVNGVANVTLGVEGVLKGSLAPGSLVSLTWARQFSPRQSVRAIESDRGLFFLRRDAKGDWRVLPAMAGDVDFESTFFLLASGPQPVEFSAPGGASIEERVFLELAWAETVRVPGQRGAVLDLVSSYQQAQSNIVREVFKRFADSSSDRLAMVGLRGLVAAGEPGALARVEQQQQTLLAQRWGRGIIDEIEFQYKNADPEGVKILGRLATASDSKPDLRIASALALARLHTRDSLPYLAQLLDRARP